MLHSCAPSLSPCTAALLQSPYNAIPRYALSQIRSQGWVAPISFVTRNILENSGCCNSTNLHKAKQHARSVAKHLGVKEGLIYLLGQPSRLLEDSDMPVPFRQRRFFYYLSGADFEDCIVT